MMKYRVKHPLITMDGQRDFDTREEAEAFAAERRNDLGRFLTVNSWRHVQIYEAPPWATATKIEDAKALDK
jgi:hypothetical protein